jgi:hypothetical protein
MSGPWVCGVEERSLAFAPAIGPWLHIILDMLPIGKCLANAGGLSQLLRGFRPAMVFGKCEYQEIFELSLGSASQASLQEKHHDHTKPSIGFWLQ